MKAPRNPDGGALARPVRRDGRHGLRARPWWPWARRLAYLIFLGVVAYLLFGLAREVKWDEVTAALRRRPPQQLALAAALAFASHAVYSCFDLLGRRYTGHHLRTGQVMPVNFISYAFNLNLGALVGGAAFRYRLYSRLGLPLDITTRVVFFSMLTNWLGYVLLSGIVFLGWPIELPPGWKLGGLGLELLAIAQCALAVAYVLLCAFARRRSWTVRGHEITLPPFRLALLQLVMSIANWMIMAAVITVLLGWKLPYALVLEVLLIAAIAGAITHVPAGLGVLEAVFVALLAHRLPASELLAALLAYRVVHYLIPLVAAALLYLVLELRARKTAGKGK